jgi:hypothetical protein
MGSGLGHLWAATPTQHDLHRLVLGSSKLGGEQSRARGLSLGRRGPTPDDTACALALGPRRGQGAVPSELAEGAAVTRSAFGRERPDPPTHSTCRDLPPARRAAGADDQSSYSTNSHSARLGVSFTQSFMPAQNKRTHDRAPVQARQGAIHGWVLRRSATLCG